MTVPAGGHPGELLSALADGELSEAEAASVHAHLAACPGCAADRAATEEVRALVRGLGPVEPRRSLLAPVARPSRVAGLVAAAAAAVALLALSGVEAGGPAAPRVARLVQVHATSPVNTDPVSQVAPAAITASFP